MPNYVNNNYTVYTRYLVPTKECQVTKTKTKMRQKTWAQVAGRVVRGQG